MQLLHRGILHPMFTKCTYIVHVCNCMCIFVLVMMIKWCLKLPFYLYRFTVDFILQQVCIFN